MVWNFTKPGGYVGRKLKWHSKHSNEMFYDKIFEHIQDDIYRVVCDHREWFSRYDFFAMKKTDNWPGALAGLKLSELDYDFEWDIE